MRNSLILAVLIFLLSACSPRQANLTYWTNTDLAGIDADHNGIRDDVDEWINAQPYEPKEKRAMQKYAANFQKTMTTDPANVNLSRKVIFERLLSMDCVLQYENINPDKYNNWLESMESIVFNTKARIIQGYNMDKNVSGMSWTVDVGATKCE